MLVFIHNYKPTELMKHDHKCGSSALLPEVEKKTFGFLMNLTVELPYSFFHDVGTLREWQVEMYRTQGIKTLS